MLFIAFLDASCLSNLLSFSEYKFIYLFFNLENPFLMPGCLSLFNNLYVVNQEPTRPAIPILLAVGAVHQHLIQNGLRVSASIVADTAQCFSTHQFACLIGYGARLFSFFITINHFCSPGTKRASSWASAM